MCPFVKHFILKFIKKQYKWSAVKCFAMVICQYAMQIPNNGQKRE